MSLDDLVETYKTYGLDRAINSLTEFSFDNQSDLAWAKHFVGDWLTREGRYEEALRYYSECLKIFYELKDIKATEHTLEELDAWFNKWSVNKK